MTKRVTLLFAAICAIASGCGADQTDEIINNLVQAGFPMDDIMVVDGWVYVGRDAHVTLEASREILQVRPGTSEEQYRTNNLVSGQTKICVTPTSTFTSYSRLNAGLDLAIANYNGLGLAFTFARGPATGCSANINAKTTSGVGGSSGFPSGGKPYGTINIGTGLQSYSDDVNEHVITHEIGHTLGLRHSDYYDRSISCGSGGNEGTAGVGAIHIPGTPTDARVGGSVMNSCFRANESGEWSSSDRTALQYLY
jgi:dual-action HEIGH metallo-peptidase